MKKLGKILSIFLVFCFLSLPLLVHAAENQALDFVCNLLRLIRNIIAGIGLGLAVILLIVGGIQYMTAGGNPEKAEKSKKLMINAIIGIAIVIAAMFIITLVASIITGAGGSLNPFGDPCGQTPL